MSPRKPAADERSPTERAYTARRAAYDAWVAELRLSPLRASPSAWIETAFNEGWEAQAQLALSGNPSHRIERLAFEAMQWARDPAHNIGNDQPSLVFARRFNFLLQGGAGPGAFCDD